MAIEERSTERASQRLGNRISLRNLVRLGEARADDRTTRLLNEEEREEQGRNGDTNAINANEAREIIDSARRNGDRLRFSEDRTQPGHYLVEIAGRRGAVEVDMSPEAAALFQNADDILVGRPQLRGLNAAPVTPAAESPAQPAAGRIDYVAEARRITGDNTIVDERQARSIVAAAAAAGQPITPAQPAAAGPAQPAAAGPEQPAAAGPEQPAAAGPEQPAAAGPEQPAAAGPAQPAQPAAFAAGSGTAARPYNRVTVPNGLHQNQVEAVQGLLVNAGLNVGGPGGAADGKWGRHSQAAFEQLCREAQPQIDPATVDFNNLQDPETVRFVQAAQARAEQRAGRGAPEAPAPEGPASQTPQSDRWLQQYTEMSPEQLQQLNERYNARTTPAFNDVTALENHARTTMGEAITADGVISPAERALLSQSANGRVMLAFADIPPLPANATREQMIERYSLIDRLGEIGAAGGLTDGPVVERIIAENRTAVTAALAPQPERAGVAPAEVAASAEAGDQPAPANSTASRTIEEARTNLVGELQGTIGAQEARIIETMIATNNPNGAQLTDRNGQINSSELGAFQGVVSNINTIEGLDQLRDQLRAAGVRDGQTVAGGEVVVASAAPNLLPPGQGAGVTV